MGKSSLMHLEKVVGLLDKAIAASPADFTELVWVEQRSSRATTSPRPGQEEGVASGTLIATVQERGRFGGHRTDSLKPSHLHDAVRQALAQAKVNPPLRREQAHKRVGSSPVPREQLFDPQIARLDPARARELLGELVERHERAHLQWTEGEVAIVNSERLRRKVRATQATLFTSSGRGPEAGTARASARSLKGLQALRVMQRARERRAEPFRSAPSEPISFEGSKLVFSPEAAASLLEEWSRVGFLALPQGTGESFHLQNVGQPVFSPQLQLRDDPLAPTGLPFPYGLRGEAKKVQAVVTDGVPEPLPSWPEAPVSGIGNPGEGAFQHLSMERGESEENELLAAASGGLWIGSVQRISVHDPSRLRFYAHLRGLRRIADGRRTEALPDSPWEGSLPDLLGQIQLVGRELARRAASGSFLGGVTAPGFAVIPAAAPPATF